MYSFLREILADPASGEALELVNNEYFLNARNGLKYPISKGVANLMQHSEATVSAKADIHAKANTDFNYRDHYEKDAFLVDYFQDDEALVTRNERKRNRQAILDQVPTSANTILDIGCGGAWVAGAFVSKGKNVISMDISSLNPIQAREKYPQQNHEAIIADAMYLPFKNDSIDCVIASEVIEHVPDPAQFIGNILNKVKPGGKLILMTPFNEKIRYHLCVHCNSPIPQNGHLHSFTESKIIALVPAKVAHTKAEAFCNKYFLKLRLYNLLSFLPFSIWKVVDNAANMIAKKPLSLLTVVTKNG